MMKYLSIAILLVLHFSVGIKAQDFSKYQKDSLKTQDLTLPYRVLLPENYSPEKKYPLVLFLHGAGERGTDNEKQLTHGGKMFLDPENRKNFEAIVVFPQCPEGTFWSDVKVEMIDGKRKIEFVSADQPPIAITKALLELLSHVEKTYSIHQNKRYVMGLSMGGFGTLHLLSRKPDYFASAVVICGGGNMSDINKYAKKLPIWLTHGDEDNVVPVQFSRDIHASLKEKGAKVKYTEFPGVDHNAWDPTFELPELLPWIFSHSK